MEEDLIRLYNSTLFSLYKRAVSESLARKLKISNWKRILVFPLTENSLFCFIDPNTKTHLFLPAFLKVRLRIQNIKSRNTNFCKMKTESNYYFQKNHLIWPTHFSLNYFRVILACVVGALAPLQSPKRQFPFKVAWLLPNSKQSIHSTIRNKNKGEKRICICIHIYFFLL